MAWRIKFDSRAVKELSKLDKNVQVRINQYIKTRLQIAPHDYGEPLQADLKGYWKYRVGDYRLICEIFDNEIIILVLRVGHRSKIYKNM